MTHSADAIDPLDELAEEFLALCRRGERPSTDEYAACHPDLADRIRALFPALLALEHVGAAVAPPEAGGPTRLGEFRIVREIGRGGMGIVYEAVQESVGRPVALKVLPPGVGRRADTAERFRREARAAAKLHHTNIVPVFSVGEWRGTLYFAMQFIRGCGLDAVVQELRRVRGAPTDPPAGATKLAAEGASGLPSDPPAAGPPPAAGILDGLSGGDYYRAVARLGVQAADALAHAHAHGVLHRDVKPSNLLLDDQGTLWVADFGLAKADDADDLTASGDIVGTLRYLAPERFAGRSDARSDVYALGATLYELLTMRPPFEAADRPLLIERIGRGGPVPPSRLDPAIPRDLETVVLKALALNPADRYATAADLADDLRNVLAGRPPRARRTTRLERTWRWCRRNPVVAGLTAALAVLLPAALVTVSVLYWQEEKQRKLAEANAIRAATDAARADEKGELARATVDKMLSALGSKLGNTTDIPKVRTEMYERAVALYRTFAEEPGGNGPAVRRGQGNAYSRLGSLYRELGRHGEALDALRRSEGILVQLAAEDPVDRAARKELVVTFTRLAHLLRTIGDGPGAAANYRRAADLDAELAREAGEDPATHSAYTAALNNLAVVLREIGRPVEAVGILREHVAADRRRLAVTPTEVGLRHALAMHLSNLAILLFELNEQGGAIEACREAVAVDEQLVGIDPKTVSHREELADAANNLGLMLFRTGQTDVGISAVRRALEFRSGLARDLPDVPQYRHGLAQAHANLASLLADAGRPSEAVLEVGQAIPLLERLAADAPAVPVYSSQLAFAYHTRGRCAAAAGRHADALADYDRGNARIEAKADTLLKSAENRRHLALGYGGRAEAFGKLGRYADAVKDWDRAVALAADRTGFPAKRANALARAGDVNAAIRAADEFVRVAGVTPEQLCGAAGVYAVAAGETRNDANQVERLAGRAVELLRQSFAKGFANIPLLLADADLAPLRGRTDYADLLWDLADMPAAPAKP